MLTSCSPPNPLRSPRSSTCACATDCTARRSPGAGWFSFAPGVARRPLTSAPTHTHSCTRLLLPRLGYEDSEEKKLEARAARRPADRQCGPVVPRAGAARSHRALLCRGGHAPGHEGARNGALPMRTCRAGWGAAGRGGREGCRQEVQQGAQRGARSHHGSVSSAALCALRRTAP